MNTVDEKYEHHCNYPTCKPTWASFHEVMSLTGETVDARGDGALVGQISGDAAFVLGSSTSDEGRVEDEPILGGVATSLQGSE